MEELRYPFNSNNIIKKKKKIRKQLIKENHDWVYVRIAILGGSTTIDIKNILELFLLNEGIAPIFYESDYGKYWEEAMFGNEKLNEFKPDIVYFHTSYHNIQNFPEIRDSREQVEQKLEQEYEKMKAAWENVKKKFGCVIIQNNYTGPMDEDLGNRGISDFHGKSNFISKLNLLFYQYSQEQRGFYINDIETLAAKYGLDKWQDPKWWFLYKYFLSLDAIPTLAYQLSNIIKSLYGKSKKVLVLDADNTLWGGIIGECGPNGIILGEETSEGQAFVCWQKYIKRLKEQGIVLCINSKNEENDVRKGLENRDSILKIDDFSALEINWNDKATNMITLAKKLNLDLEQMVFVDDNPAERELVRQRLPQVSVVEANSPGEYIYQIRNAQFFDQQLLSEDDKNRTLMYISNEKRMKYQEKFEDYDDYLESLEMTADISCFKIESIERITQLINKTNQFNLTTWRLTEEEVRKLANDRNWICLAGRLVDKFGDNGIVAIIIGEKDGEDMHIREFLLSCRVFNRGMENEMMNSLAQYCEKLKINNIFGYYLQTKKNTKYAQFYESIGFVRCGNSEEMLRWKCKLDDYSKIETKIKCKTEFAMCDKKIGG